MPLPFPQAVLFDLDGTLADTAPDLAAAVNKLRTDRGMPLVDYHRLRPYASAGARGLVGAAFGIGPGDDAYEALRTAFLDEYESSIAVNTRLFDGVPALLQSLTNAGIPWGIVTNKASRFTNPLIPRIGLAKARCIVSGDTTPHSKPHPAPLLEAARLLGIHPEKCWYVGDDLRDVEAGRAAGMTTVAAGWGYCGDIPVTQWEADAVAETPAVLLDMLGMHASGTMLSGS